MCTRRCDSRSKPFVCSPTVFVSRQYLCDPDDKGCAHLTRSPWVAGSLRRDGSLRSAGTDGDLARLHLLSDGDGDVQKAIVKLAIQVLQIEPLGKCDRRIEPPVGELRVGALRPALGSFSISLQDELVAAQVHGQILLSYARQHGSNNHLVFVPSRFHNRAEHALRIWLSDIRTRPGAISRAGER